MTGWAIVAIPREGDQVWKYSSEKVPHMTLLFLGEQKDTSDLSRMASYIDHVTKTSLQPFYMTVERRGELGPDNADVLFFNKNKQKGGPAEARDFFLKDEGISAAYNSIDQYPEWTPHLTMGYPATPAKKNEKEYDRFYSVEFDRIALWYGDYEGLEFQLHYPEYSMESESAMAMTETVDAFLAHYGTKGMKWGVRNDRGHEGERATTKKIAKLDSKFEKSIGLANKGVVTPEFHNAVVRRMNARIDEINDSKKYRDVDVDTFTGKIKSDYEKDTQDAIMRSFEDATREQYGSNASGTKKAVYNRKTDSIDIIDKDVKHAAGSSVVPDVTVRLNRNKVGLISSTTMTALEVSHSAFDVEAFLEHFGVKGMQWGRRKAGDAARNAGSDVKEGAKQALNDLKNGSTNRKKATVVATLVAGPALVAGALITDKVMRKHGTTPVAVLQKGANALKNKAKSSVPDGETIITQKKPGTKLTAEGGKKLPAHEDAVKAALAKQQAKASSTDALSNAELKALVERMNLEKQYSTLTAGQVSPGRKLVNEMLTNFAKSQAQKVLNDQGGRLINEAVKKAGK